MRAVDFSRARWQAALVGALLVLYVVMAVSATTQESNTFDEAEHLTTGYLYWVHSDEKLNPGIGVLAQAWAALPLLFDHLNVTPGTPEPPGKMTQWAQGYRFFYMMGNNPTAFLLQARFMISLLGAALGCLVFFWSRELFGMAAGLVSLFLFVFCPTMLAHGALVTADMAVALCFFAATLCFWRLMHRVSAWNLTFSILAFAGLVLAKMSAVLIVPIFVGILLVRCLSRLPVEVQFSGGSVVEGRWAKAAVGALALAAHAVVTLALLWLVYRFSYFGWNETANLHKEMEAPGFSPWSGHGMRLVVLDALERLRVIPPAYMEGFSHTLRTMSRGGSLLGFHSHTGSVWFFPVAFLIKTPLSTLALVLLSLVALALWRRNPNGAEPSEMREPRRPGLYDLSPLLILGGVYGAACLTAKLNIGHRHMMPVYPVLFVLAGANAHWLRHPRRLAPVAVAVLLSGVAAESLYVRPHYLAFFNLLVGGPRHGYRYLVDSSLDWGQDLPGLRTWLDRNSPAGGGTKVFLSYFGTGDPAYFGINAARLPNRFSIEAAAPVPLEVGIYCISATSLQEAHWTPTERDLYIKVESELAPWEAASGSVPALRRLVSQKGKTYWTARLKALEVLRFDRLCEYLRQREPDDEVGYSVLIYRLSEADLARAQGVAPTPATSS